MSTSRIAAFQRQPRFGDVAGTTDRLLADLEWCDGEDVDLALFPECYLQGYVLDRPTLSRRALALEQDEAMQSLLARLRSIRSTFILGLIERHGTLVFNTAAVIRRGCVLGAYRKTNLHPKEKAFDAGHDYPVFEVGGWPFGINICNDANFPEAAAMIARQRARLLCYPINNMLPPDVAARWRSRSVDNLQRRAAETGCWVVSSDVVGEHEAMCCHGCTCIVNPSGDLVARVAEDGEGVAMLDLDEWGESFGPVSRSEG
jgi:predicted amidohydrolase